MKAKFVLAFLLAANTCVAQDLVFARKMLDTLTSPYFWGRGYTKDGVHKAAGFLSAQFKSYGLTPMDGKNFLQEFSFPVNTFPAKMELFVNREQLTPGKDYIVAPESASANGKYKLVQRDSATFADDKNKVVLSLENKLTWSVAQKAANYTGILLRREALKELPASIKINIENKFYADFKTANVCGIVKGTARPDSFIVFSAHYDHLGGMGSKTYFAGANDNASGTTLLLELARYYAANPQRYSMAFICFAGEEAGLLGSKYFTDHPLIPLKNIRFLVNADIVGTGDEGITVVNATEHSREFAMLNQINKENNYLPKINSRGKAANSDHYWFTKKNVPAFFIYTMGGIRAYHDVFDLSGTLPLTGYANLFKLLLQFNKRLLQNPN